MEAPIVSAESSFLAASSRAARVDSREGSGPALRSASAWAKSRSRSRSSPRARAPAAMLPAPRPPEEAMRLRTAAWILLAAAPALAGVPEKGDGTITLLGGLRAIPGGDYQSESGNKHSLWHPGFLIGFGFQP